MSIEHIETTNPVESSLKPDFGDALKGITDSSKYSQGIAQATEQLVGQGLLPDLSIGKVCLTNPFKEPVSREAAAQGEAENAQQQLPGLMDRLGAPYTAKDGLTHDDLKELQKDRTLTHDQRRAVEYMMDNYDALQTGGWRFNDRITPESLRQNAGEATNVDPAKLRMDEFNRKIDEASRKPQSVEVKKGWSWYQVAQESLRVQGQEKPNHRDILKEQERLKKLNPGPKYRGDQIRIR